jgi:hypothetical protein
MNRRPYLAACLILIALILGSIAAAGSTSLTAPLVPAAPADPHKVLGNETCVKCHTAEQAVWAATPHAKTFDELHRRREARQIASRLGIESIKHGDRCLNCHYTRQSSPHAHEAATHFSVIAGVSCESCHGPARDWLDVHHDYGGPEVTRLSESPQHRLERIARSVELGMRNPHNVYLVAQSCYRCHTTADEELVNVGGHPAGSLTFEFVSWSQGQIHHNFVRSDGKQNQPSSPERLRVMFVAGVIADTEASLRAVATATQKATYGINAAQRAARAGARLKSLASKIDDPRLTRAAEVFDAVELKLNHRVPLIAAADELAMLGYDLAENPPTAELPLLDRFIPERSTWK